MIIVQALGKYMIIEYLDPEIIAKQADFRSLCCVSATVEQESE